MAGTTEQTVTASLRLVAWEITRRCNLSCAHCRASSEDRFYEDELSIDESYQVIDGVRSVGQPILILTGGEPLVRPDVFEIAGYAVKKGLRVVMGTNGTLITKALAAKLSEVPVSRVSVSLDFPTAEKQDVFRGRAGAYQEALNGIANALDAGIEIQINSTITRQNIADLPDLLGLAADIGAVAFHPFMLVPTGRGQSLASEELSAEQYEEALTWIHDKQIELRDSLFIKPTDAPQYMRILKQRLSKANGIQEPAPPTASRSMQSITRGCLAGTGFCFISYRGGVQGCGYMDIEAGNVRNHSFAEVWSNAPLFNELRDFSNLKGKCGICEFRNICGGCRARAYASTGDHLESEPNCLYQPQGKHNLKDAEDEEDR